MKLLSPLSLSASFLVVGGVLSQIAPANAASLNGVVQAGGALELPNNTTILFAPDEDTFVGTAPVGEYAAFNIPSSSNTGDFTIYNSPNPFTPPVIPYLGSVLSVDTSLATALPFIVLPAATNPPDTTGPSLAETEIFVTSFSFQPLPPSGGFVQFAFNGTGFAVNDGDISQVEFDFTAQGEGSVLDPFSIFYSYSGTITFTHQDVPEPTSSAALIGLGLIGGGMMLKRRIR
jgi:hypothetical protein